MHGKRGQSGAAFLWQHKWVLREPLLTAAPARRIGLGMCPGVGSREAASAAEFLWKGSFRGREFREKVFPPPEVWGRMGDDFILLETVTISMGPGFNRSLSFPQIHGVRPRRISGVQKSEEKLPRELRSQGLGGKSGCWRCNLFQGA